MNQLVIMKAGQIRYCIIPEIYIVDSLINYLILKSGVGLQTTGIRCLGCSKAQSVPVTSRHGLQIRASGDFLTPVADCPWPLIYMSI